MTPADIRSARESLGLTRHDLADRLGVSYGAIASWEAPIGRADHRPLSGPALRLIRQLIAEAAADAQRAPVVEVPAPKRPRGRPKKSGAPPQK